MHLGKSLKIALIHRDITQLEFSKTLGVSPATLTRWIKTGELNVKHLGDICDTLELSVYEFVRLGDQNG